MNKQEFFQTYGPLAKDIGDETGLDPSTVLGLVAQETGWGNHYTGHNIFGISPSGPQGQYVAQYPSISDAAQAFVSLANRRYQVASNAPVGNQGQALARGGYNTVDQDYGAKVEANAAQIRAMQQDHAPSADDILKRMQTIAPTQAAPQPQQSDQAPSADQLLERMQSMSPTSPAMPAKADTKAAEPPDPYHEVSDASATLDKAAASSGIAPAAARVGQAAVQGYQDSPPLLTPEAEAAVKQGGPVGQWLVAPAAKIVGGGLGLLNAAGAAIGQGAYEAGNALGGPAMGRDFYMGQQVAPFAAMGAGVPNMLEPPSAGPRFVQERFGEVPPGRLPQLLGAIDRADQQPLRPPGSLLDQSSLMRPEARPTVGEAVPQSVGAAASRDQAIGSLPEQTRGQVLRDLESSVTQTAEERAGPQMRDDTPYVKGIPPRPLAAREYNALNALDQKVAYAKDPEFRDRVDTINRQRNEGMVDLLRGDAQDAIALEKAHEARSEVSPDALGVFKDEKPVDASGLVSTVDSLLKGPDGKRAAIRSVLNDVRASLFDADGNLETAPSQLYGARKNITDMLKKGVKGVGTEADNIRAAKSILSDLLPQVDATISDGAPKFSSEYLKQWSDLSKPIDQMEFLQRYQTGPKKITNDQGYLQPGKVQKMLDDILQLNKASGVNPAKSLTGDQIQNIVNVRNELAADQLRQRLSAVPGSDTFQQLNRPGVLGRGPIGGAVKGLGELGLGVVTGGTGNIVYHFGIKPAMEQRRLSRIAEQEAARKRDLLAPPNYLNPP